MASVSPFLRRLRSGLVLAVVGMMAPLASAAEPPPADLEFFEKRIRPVLARACFDCHSGEAKSVKGGLRLDTHEALLKGGENGSVVTPGDPQSSRLIASVRWTDEEFRMPPKRSLAAAEIADLEQWVRRGAPWPVETASNSTPR
ncbi:MAG: c-type cytochrome domain-containing protein, partial [Verrucomicrobiota bacterium]